MADGWWLVPLSHIVTLYTTPKFLKACVKVRLDFMVLVVIGVTESNKREDEIFSICRS